MPQARLRDNFPEISIISQDCKWIYVLLRSKVRVVSVVLPITIPWKMPYQFTVTTVTPWDIQCNLGNGDLEP